MPYRLLADVVLLLHLGFVAFSPAARCSYGVWPAWPGCTCRRWPGAPTSSLPGAICPLTPLENALRVAGGGAAYDEGFIEHYLLPLVYPGFVQGEAGRGWQVALGIALVAGNAVVYALLLLRRRRALDENRPHEEAGTTVNASTTSTAAQRRRRRPAARVRPPRGRLAAAHVHRHLRGRHAGPAGASTWR